MYKSLAVGYGDQLLTGKRSHSPTPQFPAAPMHDSGHCWKVSGQDRATARH